MKKNDIYELKAMIDRLELVVLSTLNTETMILLAIAGHEKDEDLAETFIKMAEENRGFIARERERIDGLY